jgi:hypothetical protein
MLLKAAGAGSHVCLSDITSQPAMNKLLTKMPLCAVVRDELTSFLSRLVNPRSNSWEQSLVGMLCTLWSNNFDQFDTTLSKQEDPVIVQGPAISLFGTATPGTFWPLLQGTQVANGLFSRFLVFESDVRPDAQKIPVPVTVPAALKDRLVELYQFGCGPVEMAQLNDPNIEFTPQVLPWASGEAEEVYEQLDKRIKREIDNDPNQEEYLGRIAEQALRLTTIRAAGIAGHQGKVGVADITWGADLVEALVRKMMVQSQGCLPQTTRGQFVESLVNYIVSQGPVTRRELQQRIKGKHRTGEIADMLKQSIEAGDIIATPNGYAAPPKPTKK